MWKVVEGMKRERYVDLLLLSDHDCEFHKSKEPAFCMPSLRSEPQRHEGEHNTSESAPQNLQSVLRAKSYVHREKQGLGT